MYTYTRTFKLFKDIYIARRIIDSAKRRKRMKCYY